MSGSEPAVDQRRGEQGSVTVVVALTLTALMGLLALGIDLGALFNARSEAQRAADAAALAGASAFLEQQGGRAASMAESRALDFATSNVIRSAAIAPEEVTVWVDTEAATVRAHVRRDDVPTWFARLFGVETVDIGAEATAWAGEAGAAQCVKPFAVPDLWEETDDDLNGNRIWDEGEQWSYDPDRGDRYAGFSGADGSPSETGYGSGWRDGGVDGDGRRYDGDYGRRITVKVTDPRATFQPSFFLPWVLPGDRNQAECGAERPPGQDDDSPPLDDDGGGWGPLGWLKWSEKREDLGVNPGNGNGPGGNSGNGGDVGTGGNTSGSRGAAAYRRNICSCNSSIIDLDSEYDVEPGNMVGPTYQGVAELIALDPNAYWDASSNTVVSEYGMNSPRVVTVGLFDPDEIDKPGRQTLKFNNFARIFIEEQVSRRDPVTGRFLYYVPGVGTGRAGETTGSLVRVLQLIR